MTYGLIEAPSLDVLWELCFGDESFVGVISNLPGIGLLSDELYFQTIDYPELNAGAYTIPDQPEEIEVEIFTGAWTVTANTLSQCIEVFHARNPKPWVLLGWKKDAFSTSTDFVEYLTMLAMDFLALHELAHVAKGHVSYYRLEFGARLWETRASVEAAEERRLNSIPAIQRQALELDADDTALYILSTLMLPVREKLPRYQRGSEFAILTSFTFVARLLFALFAEMDAVPPSEDSAGHNLLIYHEKATHPHPSIRYLFLEHRLIDLANSQRERRISKEAVKKSEGAFLLALLERALPPHVIVPIAFNSGAVPANIINSMLDEKSRLSNVISKSLRTRMAASMEEIRKLQRET
ncbi:hypothetical protein [Hyalangium versicolor]|uniref:hypothetical protein n=1 Tax=Hyalangium versicolor TaxID=2861190 RepID=UPI001CCF89C8|nr:hypothetical protein [Hyalangium versicolor]